MANPEFLRDLGALLNPGDSAIFAVLSDADTASQVLRGYSSVVLRTSLTETQASKLRPSRKGSNGRPSGAQVPGMTIIAMVAVVCSLATSCSKQSEQAKKVGSNLKAKAKSRTTPDTAKKKSQQSSIGKGQLTASVGQPSSFWTEEVDVDDDAVVETSDFLFDSQNGILYTYREDDFACPDGGTTNGGILEALYADGNKAGKPVGSGWYAVNLNATQCGAKNAGVYGCRFDADGNPTTCGAATINNQTGDIDVVVAQ